jgi:dolichyl-phosphate-mannose--protein O-mannosyl transferase
MGRRDILPLLLITVVYGFVAYFSLGSTEAPQNFYRFSDEDPSVELTLSEETEIGSLMYYTGLWTGHYTLQFSLDGINWTEQVVDEDDEYAMDQSHSDLFKWLYATLNEDGGLTKYIRITATSTPMELGEIALYDGDGNLIPSDEISTEPAALSLFDEQSIIPDAPSYLNSMYFDEIYHGRTAYENIENVYPYEITHPPLGKLIISLGIRMFGMTPFGWRFMGTLFGILMLPLFYVFLKNMFGKTIIASCGTVLFAADFMHFVQTRIATIDTYGVFFILLMYFFMYRYITHDYEAPFRKTLLPLALSGLAFGLGCASKWTCVYAGAGLAVLLFLHLFLRGRHYIRENGERQAPAFVVKTLLFSCVFFVIVPAVIYCLSYIPYGLAKGMTVGGGMLWNGDYYKLIWDNQTYMYNYHSRLTATHSYSSTWWMWILDIRPILYYLNTSMGNNLKSAFGAFGNPVVWWGGFLAMVAMIYRTVKYRDGIALFILIGYLSQLVPWLFVTRVVFIYHYFPSVIFLVLALAHVLNTILERKQGRYRLAVVGFTAAAVFLFVAFYPVLSGLTVPRAYTTNFLRWIPWMWPF